MDLLRKRFMYCCLLVVITINPAKAQITIGSTNEPLDGTILQLNSAYANTNPLVNSNKGLILPRVFLSNYGSLLPMLENNTEYTSGTSKASEDAKHTGLLVYNTNKCLYGTGDNEGLYVWDGARWSLMTNKPLKVSVFTDPRDGEQYKYNDFGQEAGVWMLENMRATTYADGSSTAPTNNLISSETVKYFVYPFPVNQSDGKDKTTYEADKNIGLLYNWAAATNNENPSSVDQGNSDYTPIRGICPEGWHLPSDKEWLALENEILTNTSKYSSIANIGAGANLVTMGYRGGELGKAMKASCPPISRTNAYGGVSKSTGNGGLYVRLIGYGADDGFSKIYDYGYLTYIWTSSSYPISGTKKHAWHRGLATDLGNNIGVNRGYLTRGNFLSVRCKQD